MAELRIDTSTSEDEPADRASVSPGVADGGPDDHGGGRRRRRGRGRGFWSELPVLVIIALALAILLKTFVVQAFYIPSSSMEPTLQVGDRVLVTKTAYLYREPVRGEVVVFTEEAAQGATDGNALADGLRSLGEGLGVTQGGERDFIKRIIGLPGDTIELRAGEVFVNGEPLPEAPAAVGGYLAEDDTDDFGPVTVEPDHYFMLGDNRANSADSRFGLGQIHRDQIVGRAFVTLWPLTSAASLSIPTYDR